MTPSEKFVFDLCKKSFLPFWSHPNPIGKKGKELCDVLIVCQDIVIIISVKEIKPSKTVNQEVRFERWFKNAVEKSIKQIYGAERYLRGEDKIELKNGEYVELPPHGNRQIYRISISFGSENNYPFFSGDMGSGYVHIFDESATSIIIQEQDTISDFIDYLKRKEHLLSRITISGAREIDFFAFYLTNGLDFYSEPINKKGTHISLDKGLWESYLQSEDYSFWKKRIEASYIWDEFIEKIYWRFLSGKDKSLDRTGFEESLRLINLENRIHRIELSTLLKDALQQNGMRARIVLPMGDSNHMYVLMPFNEDNFDIKEKELELRCMVARANYPENETIIGVSIGKMNSESAFDIAYFHIPEIDDDFVKQAEEIKNKLGYFKKPKFSKNTDIKPDYLD